MMDMKDDPNERISVELFELQVIPKITGQVHNPEDETDALLHPIPNLHRAKHLRASRG